MFTHVNLRYPNAENVFCWKAIPRNQLWEMDGISNTPSPAHFAGGVSITKGDNQVRMQREEK